ncbi:MAG: WYL domain-containing protein [Sulfurimonas sp.]|nr:WYL domain-containing protein [Sulfurimonas sp.]
MIKIFIATIVYFLKQLLKGLDMAKKIEEILPKILKDLSNGIGISTLEIEKEYGFSASGVRNHLRNLQARFYKNCFKYDGSTKKWVTTDRGFLRRELLEPEEVIVLNGIYRNKDRLGPSLSKTHETMIESYLKRTKSYIFKQHKAEDVTQGMEQIFAILKSAINEKNIVELKYPSKGVLKTRRVFPYRIVYIEYYWYLISYEENDRMKSFRLSLIQSPTILDETYKYDFENVNLRLKLAMNAYVDFEEPLNRISVLVWEKIVEHIELASYFDAWKKLEYSTSLNGKKYQRFEVTITNPNYDDITPTIMKYMPNIIVEEPEELIEKIDEIINQYKKLYAV